jgi:hypothetical protein
MFEETFEIAVIDDKLPTFFSCQNNLDENLWGQLLVILQLSKRIVPYLHFH